MNPDDKPPLPGDPPSGQGEERSRPGVFLGTLRGIRFYLDYSWFFIAALVIYSLATYFFPHELPGRDAAVYIAMGTVATLLFFLSILLHEMGHSVVSQRNGIPVPSITLLFIGGIAEISREPDDPRTELKIAVAGPLVSIFLSALYALIAWGCSLASFPEGGLVFQWLASVNLFLVIFNAIPGYPLDGGRILRALLWMRSGGFRQATFITSRIGVFFSWALIALGIFAIMGGEWGQGLVFLVIGVFLKSAAESGYTQALSKEILDGVRACDLMTQPAICIPADLPLNLAVDDYFLTNHHVAYPVVSDEGHFRGLLRLEHLKSVPREKWPYTTAGAVAEAQDSRLVIPATSSAENALRILLVAGQGRLGVVDEAGQLVGILTRHDLLHYLQIHTELET
ncbi:MAG: site-2 protease family protein [Chthoniobacteraceae bacterium]|nr:site-2 protease family protein [Chthoniobacteraceae bacterium]